MANDDHDIDLTPHGNTPKRGEEVRAKTAGTSLLGYVGEGPDADHIRVYLDRHLSFYVEVEVKDVTGTQHVDVDQPESPRRVTLRPDANVRFVRVQEYSGPVGLIDGSLATSHANLVTLPATEVFFLCPSEMTGLTDQTTGTWPCAPGTDVWPQCSDCCI